MAIFKKIGAFVILLQYWCVLPVLAQTPIDLDQNITNSSTLKINPYSNPVILKHYTAQQLHQIEDEDPVKFQTICYYYTQSFITEPFECTDCKEFIPEQFDVWDYERFRKKSERYQRVWTKYGFKLTLLSIDELKYKLPIHTAQ